MTNARRNSYPGTCHHCSADVAKGAGFIQRDAGGRWRTYCASTACLPADLLSAARAEAAKPQNTLTANGEIYTAYDPDILPILRSMPGARWSADKKCWTVSTAPSNRARLLHLAEQIGLTIAEELYSTPEAPEVAALIDRARAAGAYRFQLDGVRHLASRRAALLADDMGTGKTVQALLALPQDAAVIAVVPACVKYNWRNECTTWRPDLTPVVCDKKTFKAPQPGEVVIINPEGLPAWLAVTANVKVNITANGVTRDIEWPKGKMQELRANAVKRGVTINRETAIKYPKPWLTKANAAALKNVILIADEAHMYKNNKAARSKKLTALSAHCAQSFALTGTPLLTKPTDLWGVLSTFGLQWDVFGSWHRFQDLFDARQGRFGVSYGTPSPAVAGLLKTVMLRRVKADVWQDMPAKIRQTLPVNGMKASTVKALNAAHSRNLSSILARLRDLCYEATTDADWYTALTVADLHEVAVDYVVECGCPFQTREEAAAAVGADNAAELDRRAPIFLPDFREFSAIRAELAAARIPAMLDIISSYEEANTPLIVASAHKAPVNALADREGWAIITGDTKPEERTQIVADFQAGKLHGVACTIAAAGVGLTLTRASHMLFVDLDWTPALNIQMEDRIHRFGQTEPCHYTTLTSEHALDRHIHRLIERKMEMMRIAIDGEGATDEPTADEPAPAVRVAPAPARLEIREETQQDAAARRDAAEAARNEAKAARKAARVLENTRTRLSGWQDRHSSGVTVTPELAENVRGAMDYLLSVCDGAVEKDDQGFNAPDAAIARRMRALLDADLPTQEERDAAVQIVHGLLRKYRNTQLGAFNL